MQIVTINGETVETAAQLTAAVKEQLKLPADWSTDKVCGYLAAVTEPTTVVVMDAEPMKRRLGAPARQFTDALLFAEERNVKYLSVLMVDD